MLPADLGDLSPFLDVRCPVESVEEIYQPEEMAADIAAAYGVPFAVAHGVCNDVLTLHPRSTVRHLIAAAAPLGPQPGWPFLDTEPRHRLLVFLRDAMFGAREAAEAGIPPMPVFSMMKSASAYTSVVMEHVMGVRTGVASLWHTAAHRPWLDHLARWPLPIHDHMPPHPWNLRNLAAAGIERVAIQVRDPRQVIISQARHSAEQAGNTDLSGDSIAKVANDLADWVVGWRRNAAALGVAVHIVRYEDMVDDPAAFFGSILDFFGGPPLTRDRLNDAVLRTEAQRLETGLNYRRGERDEWRRTLTRTQAGAVEEACTIAFNGVYTLHGGRANAPA